MWDNQTGEQTEKGKRRVRLNAYKHGMRSQIFHMMAPAKPGTYLECNTCEYFEPCKNEKWRWCPVQVEPLMRFQDAYEDGKITDLRDLAAMSQGHIFQSLRMAFQQIYKHGVLIEKVVKIEEIEHDDGSVEKVKVTEWQPNPVLRRIPELMNTLGFTAEQQMMTPKTETDDANVKGYLDSEKEKKVDLKSHLIKIENSMNDLKLQTKRAMVQRAQDEALQRHDRQVELEREESDAGQE